MIVLSRTVNLNFLALNNCTKRIPTLHIQLWTHGKNITFDSVSGSKPTPMLQTAAPKHGYNDGLGGLAFSQMPEGPQPLVGQSTTLRAIFYQKH